MNYLDELWEKYRREKTMHQYSGVAFKQAVTEALEKQRESNACICADAHQDRLAEEIIFNKLEEQEK